MPFGKLEQRWHGRTGFDITVGRLLVLFAKTWLRRPSLRWPCHAKSRRRSLQDRLRVLQGTPTEDFLLILLSNLLTQEESDKIQLEARHSLPDLRA